MSLAAGCDCRGAPGAMIRAAVPHPRYLVHLTAARFTALGVFGRGLQALAPAPYLSPRVMGIYQR